MIEKAKYVKYGKEVFFVKYNKAFGIKIEELFNKFPECKNEIA